MTGEIVKLYLWLIATDDALSPSSPLHHVCYSLFWSYEIRWKHRRMSTVAGWGGASPHIYYPEYTHSEIFPQCFAFVLLNMVKIEWLFTLIDASQTLGSQTSPDHERELIGNVPVLLTAEISLNLGLSDVANSVYFHLQTRVILDL